MMRDSTNRKSSFAYSQRMCGFVLMALLIMIGSLSSSASSVRLKDIACTHSGIYTFDGVKHDFIVDLPADPENAPIILMLHGYRGNAETFRAHTGLYKSAVSKGYIVVHVTGAPNASEGASAVGWNYKDYGRGNRDVEFLKALVAGIREEYHSYGTCCFAVGFSNGAYMCHRLAIDAADTFTAVVSVEGAVADSVWERRPARLRVGVLQITGDRDRVVPQYGDKTSGSSGTASGSSRINGSTSGAMSGYSKANSSASRDTSGSSKANSSALGATSGSSKINGSASRDTFGSSKTNSSTLRPARHAGRSTAIEDVITYYANANGIYGGVGVSMGRGSVLTMYKSDRTDRQVWHLVIKGGRHFWSAEGLTGISTNKLILSYLELYN